MTTKKIKRVFNTLFVASGVILFWRGSWGLMDLYIHPTDPLVSYLISLSLGIIILVLSNHFFDQLM